MTDDEWMVQQDREHARATFGRMERVWPEARVQPVIAPDRQMEIALAALAKQEARQGEERNAA